MTSETPSSNTNDADNESATPSAESASIQNEDTVSDPASETDSTKVDASKTWRQWNWSVLVGCGGLLIIVANWILARGSLVLDTLGNFQWQWVFLAVGMAFYQFMQRRIKLGMLLLILAVLPALFLLSFYWPAAQPEGGKTRVTMMTLNVLDKNTSYDKVAELIEEADPDILNLVEYTDHWQTKLEPMLKAYPYRVGPSHDNVIYSKIPIEKVFNERHAFDPWFSPGYGARFWVDGEMVYLLLIHTSSPTSPTRLMERDNQIIGLVNAMRYRENNMHLIIAGDFNATTHCHSMQHLLGNFPIRDSRKGFGLQNSWPTWCWPAMICIDHVFISQHVRVHQRETLRSVGSDHLPVFVELSFGKHPRQYPPDVREKCAKNAQKIHRFSSQ